MFGAVMQKAFNAVAYAGNAQCAREGVIVHTAPSGTQYVSPIDIILNVEVTEVAEELSRLLRALEEERKNAFAVPEANTPR